MKLIEGKKCQGEKQHVQVVAQERQVKGCHQLQGERQRHRSSCIYLSGSVLPAEVRSPCRIGCTKDRERGQSHTKLK